MDNAQTAQLIKNECKKKSVSVKEMLVECNVRKGFIYDLEKRSATPSGEVLEKIADYLDVSIDYLVGRTEIPEVNRG